MVLTAVMILMFIFWVVMFCGSQADTNVPGGHSTSFFRTVPPKLYLPTSALGPEDEHRYIFCEVSWYAVYDIVPVHTTDGRV